MYFVADKGRGLYHILQDKVAGTAICGARLGKAELMKIRNGRPSTRVKKEMPADVRLCKHCSGTCRHCGISQPE